MKRIVFPDTNIFLHYRSLDEVDMPRLLRCKEVEIVIAPSVFDELDSHKWANTNPRLRKRADSNLKQIDRWIENGDPIRPGVTVSYHFSRPQDATLEAHRLDRQSRDDLLFATIIEYREMHPETRPLFLAADIGARRRAVTLDIDVTRLPDILMLPQASDPLREENKRLQQQLAKLQNRMPKLTLMFHNETNEFHTSLEPQLDNLTDSMWKELRDATDEVQNTLDRFLRSRGSVADRPTLGDLLGISTQTDREIERYRQDIEFYRQEYIEYLYEKLSIVNEHRRTIKLHVAINNTGSSTAEDILLTLLVPEHLKWQWEPDESELSYLIPPNPPRPPQTMGQMLQDIGPIRFSSSLLTQLELGAAPYLPSFEVDNPSSPTISESGRELNWEIGKCRQDYRLFLPEPLFVLFTDPDKVTPFTIEYKINDPALPKPTVGKLNVLVS